MINYFYNFREAAAAAGENPKSKAEQVGPSLMMMMFVVIKTCGDDDDDASDDQNA